MNAQPRAAGIVIPCAPPEEGLANSATVGKNLLILSSNKPLSAKELEILRWATAGKTVWEISKIRSVSQATVKFHLRNIYCKLQVSNRVQAVGEAIKRGLCK